MYNYGKPSHVGAANTAVLGNVEIDILEITEGESLKDSQLQIYLDLTLGSQTSVEIRYYIRHEVGGTWYELPYRNEGTGAIASVPTIMSASDALVDSLPLPACMAFKVTAKGDNVTADGNLSVDIMSRDN